MILTKRACNRNKKTHKKMDKKKTEHQQIDTLFREDTTDPLLVLDSVITLINK